MRLANLSHAVELLRNKTEQNREMAKDAKAQSVNATLEAAGLQEVCVESRCINFKVISLIGHLNWCTKLLV